MLFSILIVLMCIAAVLQRNPERRKIALFYSAITVLHIAVFGRINGSLYYWSAAIFDMLILVVITTAKTQRSSRILITRLTKICFVSVVCNSIGWLMWFEELPPTAYNRTYILIYIAIIAIFVSEDMDVRGIASNLRHFVSGGSYSKRSTDCAKVSSKGRP